MYPIIQYIWGPDRVLAQIDVLADETYYYLYNGHGDVVQIVDTSGAIKNTYDYDVWGNFITKQETIDNHFTYFGQTYDETTGLYYLRARYYDPTTGRFTQQDPAEDGYNWYVYGNQNPVVYADLTGESTLVASAALIALGKAIQIVAGVVSVVALSALSAYQINELSKSASYSSSKTASTYISWDRDDNGKKHILKGSKTSKDLHEPIWKKFNIDPNNNNDWWKLVPILQQVIDSGNELKRVGVYEHGKNIGHNIYYIKQYVEKGVEVIVRLFVNTDGEVWLSDAWGNFLK